MTCSIIHLPLPGGGMPSWRRKTEKNWKGNRDGYLKKKFSFFCLTDNDDTKKALYGRNMLNYTKTSKRIQDNIVETTHLKNLRAFHFFEIHFNFFFDFRLVVVQFIFSFHVTLPLEDPGVKVTIFKCSNIHRVR